MKTKAIFPTLLKLLLAAALLSGALVFAPPDPAQAATCPNPVTVARGDTLLKIAIRCGTTVSALERANPEIKDRNTISVGQKLYLPGALIPGSGSTDIYIIQRGDTLLSLARRFETTLDKLLDLNEEITNPSRIYEGQRLLIPDTQTPGPSPNPDPDPDPNPTPGQTYIVRRGDTLAKIAARFNTTVETLLKLNPGIKDPDKIYVGQKITLPEAVEIYTVVRGDTLRIIAARFNTTVQKLLDLNPTIKDPDIIYVGQVLRVR